MKSLFTIILSVLFTVSFAASNDSTTYSVVKHSQATIITYDDSTGLVIGGEGIGFISEDAGVSLWKTDEGVIVAIGTKDNEGNLKGIKILPNGNVLVLDAARVIITRKSFTSHAQADNELLSGEEYYLTGDRIVYRKP
jgi:hypothetical protein